MGRRVFHTVLTVLLAGVFLGPATRVYGESVKPRRKIADVRSGRVSAAADERGRPETAWRPAVSMCPTCEGGIESAGPVGDGVVWLKANQNPTGSWGSTYEFIDTCTVIETLAEIEPDCDELGNGAGWLSVQTAGNYEYLARQIIALAGAVGYEGLAASLADELLAVRNPTESDPSLPNWPEGGWGVAEGYETDCLTTALAMKALDAVGITGGMAVNDEPLAAGATNTHEWDIADEAVKARITITVVGSTVHLRMKEGSPPGGGDPYFEVPPGSWLIVFPDSGLPFTPGHNYITVQSTGSAATYTMTASYETPTFDTRTLAEPLAYLREAQNVDGGWGIQRGQPTEFYTTLHVLLTLVEWLHYDFATEHADGIAYLESQQLGDGSFGYDATPIAYVTALATLNLVRSETYPFSTETEDAISALLAMQEVDGSWDHEPYDTALSALALWDHNQDPTADAGDDQNVVDTDEDCLEEITLDGTGSSDVDGAIGDYVWSEEGTGIAAGPSPTVVLAVGTHVIELTVTDDGGKEAVDLVIIDIAGTGVPSDVCHCCLPGGECQDVGPTLCTDWGGVPVPGACVLEACCSADGACQMTDSTCCVEEEGTPMPGEACAESPTACCLPDGECTMPDPLCCTLQGGSPQAPEQACTALEACCLSDDTCDDLDPLCCLDQGGAPQGPGTVCTAPEACCLPDDTCEILDPECCENLEGVPQGPGTTCTAAEACCLPDDTCEMLDPLCCLDQGGTSQGPATACTEPEACCLPDGGCVEVDPLCCDDAGGVSSPGGASLCFGDGNGNGLDDACEPSGLKWVQLPDLDSTGLDVQAQQPPGVLLADDFLCAQAGGIVEIRVWGSWLGDALPDGDADNVTFTLSIHADIPEGPGGWSEPGDSLWTYTFNPGEFGYEVYDSGLDEGWYDALSGEYVPSADTVCWLYTFPIPAGEEFVQEGTTEDPIVYWLDVQALPTGGEAYFGWKTSLYHWNDDAVWADGDESAHGPWQELQYPAAHPLYPESIDLAFMIISVKPVRRPMAEDCATIGAGGKCSVTGTCTTDTDCWEESHCVITPGTDPPEGVCYAPKTRYLSIARNPDQSDETARRAKLDDGTVLGWVGEPEEVDPLQEPGTIWIAEVQADPYYTETWPNLLQVYGCEIAHASLCEPGHCAGDETVPCVTDAECTVVGGPCCWYHCDPNACPTGTTCTHHKYWIQAIAFGDDIGNEDNYSAVLELQTTRRWGDVVSTILLDNGRPPEHVVGLEDVIAEIKKYQIVNITPIVWLDIDPSDGNNNPERSIGIGDILKVIDGYGGRAYPGNGPKNCGDTCP